MLSGAGQTEPVAEGELVRTLAPTIVWDGSSDGDGDNTSWHDPRNWDLDRVPNASDEVLIDVADDPTVAISTNTTIIM